MELTFLDYKNSPSPLDPVDNKQHDFLQCMIQTYCNLSSLDKPDIFDITKEHKHFLNHLIHFASKNWDEYQKWYADWCRLATKKNSTKTFVNKPWKKLKLPNYSTDYVNDIFAELKYKSWELEVPLETYNPYPDYKND